MTDKAEKMLRRETYQEKKLLQAAKSSHKKAMEALDKTEQFFPDSAFDGTKDDLVKTLNLLTFTIANLHELIAYRKMLEVD